ncbi:hypothetical protein O3M35_013340 [Rhynocoris fuscipes]|uniref:Alpha 1,4-glycosyltransferase domain-containing protein n=1 Tax=Rhynocoris fuscipes TaxID=488301 RepID=A0AAW1CG71_9HEMI
MQWPNNFTALMIIFLLALLIIAYSNLENLSDNINANNIKERNEMLNSIFMQKYLIPNNSNIFFIETSCIFSEYNPEGIHLSSRQQCAIYSTAKMNPSRPVILYHSCPLHSNFYERSSEGSKQLLKLPNFFILNIKYDDILRGSIVENIIDDIKTSQYPVEHGADVLRLALLHRFGGAYMDLDFISIKPLDSLPKNVLSPESSYELSNGFLQFDHEGKGKEFLKVMLTDLSQHFQRNTWSGNGPEVVKYNFLKFCNITEGTKFTEVTSNPCEISICNISTFYPIFYPNWKYFFKPEHTDFVMKRLNNTIAVHFWNFLSKSEKIKIGENSTYEILARQYCPDILKSAGDLF